MLPDRIKEAKSRLRIPDLWHKLGLTGTCGRKACTPWREDKNPSMSISPDGLLWKDFGTGEGGDAICFLERLWDIDRKEAVKRFIALAGCEEYRPEYEVVKRLPIRPTTRPKPEIPALRVGTDQEIYTVAGIRKLPPEAIKRAQDHGLLWFGEYSGEPAWFITDSHRCNIQARKLNGQPWGTTKALTLKGSWASWPIGIRESRTKVVLVEGGPDLLAAFARYEDRDPVCLFGASQKLLPISLPLWQYKDVLILPQNDEAGQKAAQVWAEQLQPYCKVEIGTIPPPHKDLNDWVSSEYV